jgi:alkanesulfonate monooxygenase SsuD/methylene tetrahydromethanopterin reductase-like flavin-dependent oxidoreductase (luciferase family)
MSERLLRVGVMLPLFSGDPRAVLDSATSAEAMGFDGVFAMDHVFPPGAASDRAALEAFTMLAAASAVTSRIALGTLVTRAILRPPGMTAKLAATVDLISAGRLILGVGTGDALDRGEHVAFGLPELGPAERRAHLEETIRAWKDLFTGREATGGRLVPRLTGPLLPPPVRNGGPPIWIGGRSEAIVRIAARVADGWNGWGPDLEEFTARTRLLQDEAGRAGRDGVEATWSGIVLVSESESEAEVGVRARDARGMAPVAWSGGADRFAAFLVDLASAGATWAVVVLAGPFGGRALLAERVLPALVR